MPLPEGTRFRVTKKGGKKIRLAFKAGTNQVIEAKNLKTGDTHTPKEFIKDAMKKRANKRKGK